MPKVRFGHASLSLLNKLIPKDLVVGLPSIKYNDDKVCDACAREKQVKNSFKLKNCVSTTRPLKLLHVDLCGTMRIRSRGGKKYVLVIVDDYSRFTWTLFLASKDETFEKFLTFIKKTKKRVLPFVVLLGFLEESFEFSSDQGYLLFIKIRLILFQGL